MMPDAREQLRRQLIVDEGVVLHAYADHLGYLTIGCGHLIDRRKGGGITMVQALDLLDWDIDTRIADLIERFPQFLQLDPVRQTVLANMSFQMGVDGLAEFRGTLAAVWRGDYNGAANGMLSSKWAREQTPARAPARVDHAHRPLGRRRHAVRVNKRESTL